MIESANKKQYELLIYLVLIAIVVLAYEPIRHSDFISYDDPYYVTGNPHVTNGLTVESVIWAFSNVHYLTYHPLTSLSHILDFELFGLEPLWHHAGSVLFHALNTLLLFMVFKKMTGSVWASAFVAAGFALHPLQVESVAWISERKNVLSTFFWLLTMAAYVRYAERPNVTRYMLIVVFYILALLSKPMVVTLPFVLLLLDYWPLYRFRLKSGKDDDSQQQRYQQYSAGHLIVEKLPLLVLSVILCVITFIVQRSGGAVLSQASLPFKFRIANAVLAYVMYIQKFIWPAKLAVLYPHPAGLVPMTTVAVCAVVFVIISVRCIYSGIQRRYLAVGWLWFVGTLIPVIGIIQVGSQAMADRYMYIPIMGLLIIIAWGAKDVVGRMRQRTALLAISAIAMLSAGLVCTRNQLGYWKDDFTLFDHTLKVTQNNALIHNSYGVVLHNAGRFDEALFHFEKAIEIIPAYLRARYNLGMLHLTRGRFDEAVGCFQEILKTDKNYIEAYYGLALAHIGKDEQKLAITYLNEILRINPNHIAALNELGKIYMSAGQLDQAILYFNRILALNDKLPDVYKSLGESYIRMGRLDLAVNSWNRIIELDPYSGKVFNDLAWVLATAGDDNIRNPEKAVELATRACELTYYEDPVPLDTLAVAYAAEGKFPQAVQTAEKALTFAERNNLEKLAQEIRRHLDLFRADKPYRDK